MASGAKTGAVTLIQRFGSALSLNIHLHMLFLDGAYQFRHDIQKINIASALIGRRFDQRA